MKTKTNKVYFDKSIPQDREFGYFEDVLNTGAKIEVIDPTTKAVRF